MPDILPAILATDAAEFQERLRFPGFWQPGMVAHIDILDGSMFHATCFHQAASVSHLSMVQGIELHCMVQNPLPIIETWKSLVPQTIRAIVHMEIPRPIDPMLQRIKELNLESGVALCPETPVDTLELLSKLPDRVLMMGIHPGASERGFLGEPILSKIRRLQSLHPELTIAIDGGVTPELVAGMQQAGADAFVAGSAIWQAKYPRAAYEALTHSSTLHGEKDI